MACFQGLSGAFKTDVAARLKSAKLHLKTNY